MTLYTPLFGPTRRLRPIARGGAGPEGYSGCTGSERNVVRGFAYSERRLLT